MRIKQYQVDAFARRVFEGNPAAVCPLDSWLTDETLQAIAEENNLSETAFFVPTETGFHLRWFTPVAEVAMCGHATLAAAHVIFEILGYTKQHISFQTRSGELGVGRKGDLLVMDFPSRPPQPCSAPEALIEALGLHPVEVLAADDYIAVFDNEAAIRSLAPDLWKLRELDLRGVCITAPGQHVDFVSRFFAPKLGIAEDPVTGSAHCALAPYWSSKLGKLKLNARQISKRGGNIQCEIRGDRVMLSGSAVLFSSIRTEGDNGYGEAAKRMLDLASTQPGFLGFETARQEIGISISYWSSLEAIQAWKSNAEHRAVQGNARNWYSGFRVRVCRVEREYGF